MAKILVLNGPNLNLLGSREPELYGRAKLADLDRLCQQCGTQHGDAVSCFQSNAEHELVNRIHAARAEAMDFVVFNPGAYTHTSIALRDALLGTGLPFIEVHLSNVFGRESFRHHSYLSDIAVGVISGLGSHGYELALAAAHRLAVGSNKHS